jgi:hypothetical protein
LYNAYHPVDYGFELRFHDLRKIQYEIIYFKLKENQDVEQFYLHEAAKTLLTKLPKL